MRKADWVLLTGMGLSLLLVLKAKARENGNGQIKPPKTEKPITPSGITLSTAEKLVMKNQQLISKYALVYDVEPAVIASVIMQESTGNPKAIRYETNGTIAYGLMQMTDRTSRGLGFTGDFQRLFEPELNIALGSKLLREGLDKYHNIGDSLSYYNGGAVKYVKGTWDNAKYVYGVLGYVSRFRQIWRAIYPEYDRMFTVHTEISNYGVFR